MNKIIIVEEHSSENKKIIAIVLLCHFLSSFTVLGMSVFLPVFIRFYSNNSHVSLIGLFYILPSLGAMIGGPIWGKLADKYGKKNSLLRAQIGLAIGFAICSLAGTVEYFAFGLLFQGVCGGCIAASNAYLSERLKGRELSGALNLTQSSARTALIIAPISIGWLLEFIKPNMLMELMIFLPLTAFILTHYLLDSDKDNNKSLIKLNISKGTDNNRNFTLMSVLFINFCFNFSLMQTYPYFLPFAHSVGIKSNALIGFLFGLPHLIYLCFAFKLKSFKVSPDVHLYSGFVILIVSMLIHNYPTTLGWFLFARLLMGVGMLLTYNGIHRLLAEKVNLERSGTAFGWFQSSGKLAGVVAGISAGFWVSQYGINSPFIVSTISAAIGLFYVKVSNKSFELKTRVG